MSKWQKKQDVKNYLTCKKVQFYTNKDEDLFFAWIEKIDCITHLSAAKDELYLDIVDRDLTTQEVYELIGLFARYKINMKQLAAYKTKGNSEAFKVWEKKIF